jgi:hypothetical protein
MPEWEKMCKLGKLVDDHQYAIILTSGTGKALDKIQRDNFQASAGMGRGCKRPRYRARSDLACWQTVHSLTYSCMADFMPGQAKYCLTLLRVTGIPECPPTTELWNAAMFWCCRVVLWPNQMRPLNRRTPCLKGKWGTKSGWRDSLAIKAPVCGS